MLGRENILWAPWRMSYILNLEKEEGCIFCRAASSNNDRENYVVYRSRHSFVLLNIFPYNTAHVMVAPYRHVSRPDLLSSEEVMDLHESLMKAIKAIDREYRPQGFNIGMNLGRVAGAGVESHIHIHVVPRWVGDANFMPIIGGSKVMPESLEDTYSRLVKAFKKIE